MGKYNIYAVGHGVEPDTGEIVTNKLCKSWDECQKFIKGVTGAKYKGFLTKYEASEWLKQFNNSDDNDIHNKTSNVEKPIMNKPISDIDKEFHLMCEKINVDYNLVLDMLKKQFIETYHMVMDIHDLPFK